MLLVGDARSPGKTAEELLKAKWRKKTIFFPFFLKSPWKKENATCSFNLLQKNEELLKIPLSKLGTVALGISVSRTHQAEKKPFCGAKLPSI